MNLTFTPPTRPLPSRSSGLTDEQAACVSWTHSQTGNLIVDAVPGSGKTFTILEMICEINHRFPTARIAYLVFNSKNAKEMTERAAKRGLLNTTVGTVHKFGFDAFKAKHGSRKPNGFKVGDIAEELLKSLHLPWNLKEPITRILGIAKDVGIGCLLPDTPQGWVALIEKHDIAFNDEKLGLHQFINVCRLVLERSTADLKKIDFSDMIYFPLLQNLDFPQFDFVFIDEAQDTNATRREVAKRLLKIPRGVSISEPPDSCQACILEDRCSTHSPGRLIAVGDRHQAIYGFTGADNDALDLIKAQFNCTQLPLSTCFRCSEAVIQHAQKLFPHIQSRKEAPHGMVATVTERDLELYLFNSENEEQKQRSAILCRKNAPLVSLAFRLLKRQIPCRIEGRDIGQDMIRLCKRINTKKSNSARELSQQLALHKTEQSQKLSPFKLSVLNDKLQCIQAVLDSSDTVDAAYRTIESVFSDYDPTLPPKLTLSSVHKSKGLEWPTVYLLGRNAFMPSKFATQPWMQEQEKNLIWVAITRAQETLVEVTVNETEEQ